MTATRALLSSVQSPPGRPRPVLAVLMTGTFMFALEEKDTCVKVD
jgi:hypothetical protein